MKNFGLQRGISIDGGIAACQKTRKKEIDSMLIEEL